MTAENGNGGENDAGDLMSPPKYGWKRRADQEFPEKRNPYMKVKIAQALPLVPMGARYLG